MSRSGGHRNLAHVVRHGLDQVLEGKRCFSRMLAGCGYCVSVGTKEWLRIDISLLRMEFVAVCTMAAD